MGMVGASYGGGIQLVTAAIDCRVDAIVPQIAWHSLGTSLFPAQTVKSGWGDLLYSAAAGRQLDPHITSAHSDGDATGLVTAADQQWFLDRGPGNLGQTRSRSRHCSSRERSTRCSRSKKRSRTTSRCGPMAYPPQCYGCAAVTACA